MLNIADNHQKRAMSQPGKQVISGNRALEEKAAIEKS